MLKAGILLGLCQVMALAKAPTPKPAPPPRTETRFEHFCNQARIRTTTIAIPRMSAEDGGEQEGYLRTEVRHALGGSVFTLISERLATPCTQTWIFKDNPKKEPQPYEAQLTKYIHRVSIETPQRERRVILTLYVDPVPVPLRPTNERTLDDLDPHSVTKAVYGQDSLPFTGESLDEFKVQRQRDPLFQVYAGNALSERESDRPSSEIKSLRGPFLSCFKFLDLIRNKPIRFCRKNTPADVVFDVQTTREVQLNDEPKEIQAALDESNGDQMPNMSSTYPCSQGLSLYAFQEKFFLPMATFIRFAAPPNPKPKATLDLPVQSPLFPWNVVIAGEHEDGVPFITYHGLDPLDSHLNYYVVQYQDEEIPRIAFSHKGMIGFLSRHMNSIDWYTPHSSLIKSAENIAGAWPQKADLATLMLDAMRRSPVLKEKGLIPLGSRFESCSEVLELQGIPKPEKIEEEVLYPAMNSLWKP